MCTGLEDPGYPPRPHQPVAPSQPCKPPASSSDRATLRAFPTAAPLTGAFQPCSFPRRGWTIKSVGHGQAVLFQPLWRSVGRCRAQLRRVTSHARLVSPAPEAKGAARVGTGSPPAAPPQVLVSQAPQDGAPTLAPEPPASLRSRPCGLWWVLHQVTPKQLVTVSSVPRVGKMLPDSVYSQLTPERSCPSPELNRTEATCPFQACSPRAWTRMDTGTFPCTGGTTSIRVGVGFLTGASAPPQESREPGGGRRSQHTARHRVSDPGRAQPSLPLLAQKHPWTELQPRLTGPGCQREHPAPSLYSPLLWGSRAHTPTAHRYTVTEDPWGTRWGPYNERPSEGVGYSVPKNGFHDAEPHLWPRLGPGGQPRRCRPGPWHQAAGRPHGPRDYIISAEERDLQRTRVPLGSNTCIFKAFTRM